MVSVKSVTPGGTNYINSKETIENVIEMIRFMPAETVLYILQQSGKSFDTFINEDGRGYTVLLDHGSQNTSIPNYSKS